MNRLCYSLCAALFAMISTGVFAAEVIAKAESIDALAGKISFGDVLSYALLDNPKIRKSKAMVHFANQEVEIAKSAFMPRLDLISTTQKITAYDTLPGLESIILSGRNKIYQSSTSLRLSLNIYDGGSDVAGLRLANEKVQDAKLQLQLQRADVALVVLEHVHNVRQAEVDMRTAQLQLELSVKQLEYADTRLLIDRMSTLSHTEAQYDFKSKDLNHTTKKRVYQHALQNLATSVGIEGDFPQWRKPIGTQDEYGEVLAQHDLKLMSITREIDISTSRTRQARLEVKRSYQGYLPKVDLFASREYAAISEVGYKDAFDSQQQDKGFIGITVTWNLFDGFNTTANVRRAMQRVASAEADLDITRKEHNQKSSDLERLLKDSEEKFQIESQRLELLMMKLRISREKLNLGRLDAIGFAAVETEREVQKLNLKRLAERIAYYQAKIMLRKGRE